MTMTDPFASAPAADEAQAVNEAPVSPTETTTNGVEISMTFKQGPGFDASWNVVRAASVAAANALLWDPEFKKLLDRQWEVSNACHPVSQNSVAPAAAPSSAAPRGASEPPAGSPPSPGPGWVYRSKFSEKTGKVWHAWMPPQGDDASKPVFFNP